MGIEAQKKQLEKKRIEKEILQLKRKQDHQIENIEKLKFNQDVETGMNYFDKVRQLVREGQKDVKLLRSSYLQKLSALKQVTDSTKKDLSELPPFLDTDQLCHLINQQDLETMATLQEEETLEENNILDMDEFAEVLG